MAIEKKLIHFNNKEDFQSKLNDNQIKDSSIVFVKDANMVHTHNNDYEFIGWSYIGKVSPPETVISIKIADTVAGDIVLWDKQNETKCIVNGKISTSKYPLERFTPIGIVVVPGIHAVYGENSCGIISLVDMSCNTPEIGTLNNDTMCFSPSGDIGQIRNYNVVVVEDGSGGLKTNGFGYLSKNGMYASTTLRIPDPYLSDMSRNPDYYNTKLSTYNCMSDFGGRTNSNGVLSARGKKDYITWKPVYNAGADYPAVSACDMYSVDGVTQGQWYLPAAGEWGYVMSKWDVIRESISTLNTVYGNIYKQLEDNSSYWTSTEHNTQNIRYVHTDNGMGHVAKTSTNKVRAFTIIRD